MSVNGSTAFVALILLAGGVPAVAQSPDAQSKTVIGPSNPDLVNGAEELLARNPEEGIRLTRRGLAVATSSRERQAAFANLCAGYLMIEQYTTALAYCDKALAENDSNWRALSNRALVYIKTGRYDEAKADIERGAALAPQATTIKEVRGLLLDATQPVTPNIEIDDRRETAPDGNG